MVKRHPFITVLIFLLLIAGLFFVFRPSQANSASKETKGKEKKQEEKKLPVEIAAVERGSISNLILTTASLEPDRQVTVVSETNGIISKIAVEEGDSVKEGQLLAQLYDREKEVALQNAVIRLKNAELELRRKDAAYTQKIIPQQEYDKAKFEVEVAQSVQHAAQVELDRLIIRAPFSGIITARFVEKGQNLKPQDNLFTLLDRTPLKAKVHLPEREIFGLRINQPVDFALNSQKDVTFSGRITQINPAVDSKTGTIKVTVEIEQAPPEVRPGSFVDARLVTQRHENTLLVPKKALIEEAGEQFVYVIKNNTAARRTVQTGFIDDRLAEILSGVNEGDAVVVAGQGSLRDGSKAEIIAKN